MIIELLTLSSPTLLMIILILEIVFLYKIKKEKHETEKQEIKKVIKE